MLHRGGLSVRLWEYLTPGVLYCVFMYMQARVHIKDIFASTCRWNRVVSPMFAQSGQ